MALTTTSEYHNHMNHTHTNETVTLDEDEEDENHGESSNVAMNSTTANESKEDEDINDSITDAAEVLTEEEKKKYMNWPLRDIKEPHKNDVLYGRGGGTNHHLGNKRYRRMVEDRKIDYVNCKRLDKPLVALNIIREWRGQIPMGRFLKMDEKTGLWNDVGDRKAREKTSQALREKAPQIREELEKERLARERRERGESTEEEDEEEDDDDPTTRFVNGKKIGGSNKPGIVARDHSLGIEYLNPDDNINVEGFSWQEPVRGNSDLERVGSHSSYNGQPTIPYGMPGSRMGSYSSVGGPSPPPMPGVYEHGMPPPHSDGHIRYASWNRYESWGTVGPPPHMGYGTYPSQSGGWGARDHSLGAIPLQHATVTQAAYPTTFDHRMGSAGPFWVPPSYPPPMDGGPPPYHMSGGYAHPYPGPPPMHAPHTHAHQRQPQPPLSQAAYNVRPSELSQTAPKSPPYNVDPVVASQWSGKDQHELTLTLSASSGEERDTFVSPPISSSNSTMRKKVVGSAATKLKPDLIKRATSNQNETVDTKPNYDGQSVKRAALNRDSSNAANLLKEKYVPGYFDAKTEVEILSTNFEQSTLEATLPKPSQYSTNDRMMTLDMNALDLVIRPTMLRMTSRSTTLDALNIDFDEDNMDQFAGSSPFSEFEREPSSLDDIFDDNKALSRPNVLTPSQRLTTSDLIDIVNEPLSDN